MSLNPALSRRLSAVAATMTVAALALVATPSAAIADTVGPSTTVGSSPYAVVFSADGSTLYAGSFNGTVTVIDVATNTAQATIPVQTAVVGLAVSPDGSRLYAAGASGLVTVDLLTNAVTPSGVTGDLWDVAATPDGSLLVVTRPFDGLVTFVDASSGFALADVPVGVTPSSVSLSPDGATAYVTNRASDTISVIDVDSRTVTGTMPVQVNPWDVVISPDGTTGYVSNENSSSVSIFDTTTLTVTGTVTVAPQPNGIELTPDGSRLYVATQSGSISIVDVASGTVENLVVGFGLWAIDISPNGYLAYTSNIATNTVTVVNIEIAPSIAAGAAPGATIGTPYTFTVAAFGSPAPTFAVSSGSLPAGLALDPATGIIAGSPTAVGSFSFEITATNSEGSAVQAYAVSVAALSALPAAGLDSTATLVAGGVALLLGALLVGAAAVRRNRTA